MELEMKCQLPFQVRIGLIIPQPQMMGSYGLMLPKRTYCQPYALQRHMPEIDEIVRELKKKGINVDHYFGKEEKEPIYSSVALNLTAAISRIFWLPT